MISSRSPRIDWGPLLVRLTAVAKKLFKQEGCNTEQVLPGTCVLPEDLAADAAVEFFEGTKVKWRPKSANEDPFPLIVTVMRHNFVDIVRRPGRHKTESIEDRRDEDGQSQLESTPALDVGLSDLLKRPTFGFTDVESRILAESFYPLAEGDQKLIDVIDAVVYCKCRKRREIAEWLDASAEEVTDRWEKLRYNFTRKR